MRPSRLHCEWVVVAITFLHRRRGDRRVRGRLRAHDPRRLHLMFRSTALFGVVAAGLALRIQEPARTATA